MKLLNAFFNVAITLGACGLTAAFAQTVPQRDLTQITIEDLMNVQVTSVSKKDQRLSSVAAAIYVIDSEEIRRSGATNIPDLLRMVPGVNVAQIDAHTWAISIRGFNERFTRSVLAMIDGRTIYSPLSGGVNWDQHDVPLEDIDRIEVIRGPGGTIWGANAVNGVINIITRSASATPGGLVRAGGGSKQTTSDLAQYGGSAGYRGAYRIFGAYSNQGNSRKSDGTTGSDGWHMLHGGFRSDWTLSQRDTATLQGDVSQVRGGQTIGSPLSTDLLATGVDDKVTLSSANILGHWNRTLSNGSDISLQVYYDRYNRLDTGLREIRNTVDAQFDHHFKLGSRHDIVWGAGYRITSDGLSDTSTFVTFNPPRRADSLFSTFIQDQIHLTGSVSLTVGSKLEQNGYTGLEYEPGAQLAWQITTGQEAWLSVARAIRQPTRTDVDVRVESPFTLPNGAAGIVVLSGDPDASPARVHDLEIGYRSQINRKISVDIAAFLSSYRSLLTVEPGPPVLELDLVPRLVIPEVFENLSHARSYGGEATLTWNVTKRWKISPAYSLIRIKVGLDPSSVDGTASGTANATPQHQVQFRSSLNLARKVELDSSLIYVSGLRGTPAISGYTRLDARVGKKVGESVEISIVGQNLLTPRHAEFRDSEGLLHTLVSRNFFGKIAWRF